MSDATAERHLDRLALVPVTRLKKVGTRRASALEALGISTVLDLLTYYPRKWIDRTALSAIEDLRVGEEAVVTAEVVAVRTRRPRGRQAIVDADLRDATGVITCTFFNQAWRAQQLQVGEIFVAVGRPSLYRGHLQMANPTIDTSGTQAGRIVAIYPLSEKAGVSSPELSVLVEEALGRAGTFADPLSDDVRRGLGLMDRTSAFHGIHRPESMPARLAARDRLAFDELLRLQVHLVAMKRADEREARGISHRVIADPADGPDLVSAFLAHLPFALTSAQQRVIAEIAGDLGSSVPMHRLLQGDVGSGKTVVALAALLFGVQGGYETALMVPTEVLAEQHFLAASALLSALEVPDERRLLQRRAVRVELLTARATERERSAILRALAQGEVDIVVGTHALLTDDVQFSSLGVVVIDEQHRFGVDQRAALRAKGAKDADGTHDPDLLVMTATPIPRTAAMTVYGDLDYSVLDELPEGRTPVRTRWVATDAEHETMWTAIRAELRAGRQVYVVCPLVRAGEAPEGIDASDLEIDEDEAFALVDDETPRPDGQLFADAEATLAHRAPAGAVETAERLANAELAGARIGLLHGQMPSRNKESVMSAFRSGEISVLVATTVIEVGVDVPNATVMLVVDADRFGIAQLHQLRGRVGRGLHASSCFLSTGAIGDDARSRIEALVRTGDGFELAEIDLDLRGEGTVLGVRQKGRNDLKLASLRHDRVLVQRAREVAQSLLDDDPRLDRNPVLESEVRHFVGGEGADYLFRS